MKNITICFDMDGTIADFYGVEGWLYCLENEMAHPYAIAKPLLNMSGLARRLNNLQKKGYRIAIISWLSKSGSKEFAETVTQAKMNWLHRHLPSVHWDEINIIPYGTPKENYRNSDTDILFDDEEGNRNAWGDLAFAETEILHWLEILKN